jgi:WD40 repeat protein
VNNIKVVQTKLLTSEAQLLYSASDDGFINVYNLDRLNKPASDFDDENQVKTRRAKPQTNKNPVYLFSLSSIEYTGLKKNKKHTVIEVSHKRGLILCGCYGGDLQIWRSDNYRREKVLKEGYELVSKIKAHSQTLHIITISPDENYFMTGSIDGTANIWKPPETGSDILELINDLESGCKDGGTKKEHPLKKNIIKALSVTNELTIGQCDSLKWSCRSRYAIAAFGGKENDDSTIEKSIIYVWDQKRRAILRKFGGNGSSIQLENFTFVLESHPKYENYFMSGGGGGKVILWDLTQEYHSKQVIKTFTESGIYQRDPNILNEVFDGKFSSCGKFFVVSTVWGTFTIYSTYNKESYYATAVEQFFQYDKAPEAYSNIYNDHDVQL